MSNNPSSGAGQLATSWQSLSNIPQVLVDIKAGVLGVKALLSTPSAAASTGSPVASAAIVALGAEIAVFIAQTVQAIDDDIDAMGQVLQNYQRIDGDVAAAAAAGSAQIDGLNQCQAPSLSTGPIRAGTTGILQTTAAADDFEAFNSIVNGVSDQVGDIVGDAADRAEDLLNAEDNK